MNEMRQPASRNGAMLRAVVYVTVFALGGASADAERQVASPSSTGAISGVIRDGATGQPLQGALVQLVGGDTARGAAPPRPRYRTDSRGRFIFTRLPAGDAYAVVAVRQGYFDGGYRGLAGSSTPTRMELREGEWLADVDIALWKPAAISGVVRDERGEPLVGVTVQALVEDRIAGRVRRASGPSALTDDRGMYRLANLRPGHYLIHVPSIQVTLPDGTAAVGASANSRDVASSPPLNLLRSTESGRKDGLSVLVGYFPTPSAESLARAYPMMYHPSSRSMDLATSVVIDFGDQRTNIDVQLELVPSFRVTGRVLGPSELLAHLPVRLVPAGAEDMGVGAEAALTMTDAEGAFTFLRVPTGEYTLVASTAQGGYGASSQRGFRGLLPSRADFFGGGMSTGTLGAENQLRYTTRSAAGLGALGRTTVSVGERDIDDLVVPLVGGVTISGSFLWDGSQTSPETVRIVPIVRLEPADGNLGLGLPSSASLRPDPLPVPLSFSIGSVLPGRYLFSTNLVTGGFAVESIDYGGRDLLSTPFTVEGDRDISGIVVRLTSKTMSITGFVRSTTAQAAPKGAVLFFPADRALWQDVGVTSARFATATITASGSYRGPTLPPGDYYAAAVPDADRQRFLDAEFLLTLITHATRFTLAPGSHITQDLRMIERGR